MRTIIAVLSFLAFVTVGYAMDIQEEFDPIGPAVKYFETCTGKTLVYIDEGESGWKPVLFVGGAGTSVRVFGLAEFARTLREQLKLRVISVERNGFGETLYDDDWGYEDYAEEVGELLGYLGVDQFRGVAISGGGPYLGTIAAQIPGKVVSLHFAAALSYSTEDSWNCTFDWDTIGFILRPLVADPIAWWDLGPDTSIHAVPGFQDLANDDGARTFFIRGQMLEDETLPIETPMVHEFKLFCNEPSDVSHVTAPVYLYYGTADSSVGLEHAEYWESKFENVAKKRIYEGEGHDVQYRHWDQILIDMAGKGDKTIICHNGKSKLLPEHTAKKFLKGGATLGICAWEQAE